MNGASKRSKLHSKPTAVAVVILALAFVVEVVAGFRIGEMEGNLADAGVAVALVTASVLLFAQFGRSKRFLAGSSAFGSIAILCGLNALFSTSLDVAYGGAYGWSGIRVMVLMLIVGPVISLVAGILAFAFAHHAAFNKGTRA